MSSSIAKYSGFYFPLLILLFTGCKKDTVEEPPVEIDNIGMVNNDWGAWGVFRPECEILFRVEDKYGNNLLAGKNTSEIMIESGNGGYTKFKYGLFSHDNVGGIYPLFPPDPGLDSTMEYLETGGWRYWRYTHPVDTLLYTNTYWKVNDSALHVFKTEFHFTRDAYFVGIGGAPDHIRINQVWLDGDPFPKEGGRVVIY